MQVGKTNGTTNHPQNMKSDYPSKSMNLINTIDNFFNFLSVGVAHIYHGIQNTGPEKFLHPFYEDANYRFPTSNSQFWDALPFSFFK